MSARWDAVVSEKDANAFAAAEMAVLVSSCPALGTVPMVSPVAGFTTASVSPLLAESHCPSI
jgi:hypothetical protein